MIKICLRNVQHQQGRRQPTLRCVSPGETASLLVPCATHGSSRHCPLIHRAAGRPDSTMPGQAVSPQAVDTAPTDQIKKTQLRRPDTGSLSTQLSRQTHTHGHTPPPLQPSHSARRSLTHSTLWQAGRLPTIISALRYRAGLLSRVALPLSSWSRRPLSC